VEKTDSHVIVVSFDQILYFQIDSIRANTQHNLVPIIVCSEDKKATIRFEITGLLPLSEHPAWTNISREFVIYMIESLCESILWCREHFLDPYNIIGSSHFVYCQRNSALKSRSDIKYLYQPIRISKKTDPLQVMIQEIMSSHKHLFSDQECHELEHFFCTDSNLTLERIKEVEDETSVSTLPPCKINQTQTNSKKKINHYGIKSMSLVVGILVFEIILISLCVSMINSPLNIINNNFTIFILATILLFCIAMDLWLVISKHSPIKISFLKTYDGAGTKDEELFSQDKEHTVLLTEKLKKPAIGMLCQGIPGTPEEASGQKAYILTEDFLIGRDPSQCDFIIHSTAVGRVHARISRKENSFFVEDLNSKNGTFVNQTRLKRNGEILLSDHSKIKFATSEFYFLIT
jgi:hypothetical protein